MAKKMCYELHNFFCLNCGNKMPLMRKSAKRKEKFHRKEIYCPKCMTRVNHIECLNNIEEEQFKKEFEEGNFKQEAQESIIYAKEKEERMEY